MPSKIKTQSEAKNLFRHLDTYFECKYDRNGLNEDALRVIEQSLVKQMHITFSYIMFSNMHLVDNCAILNEKYNKSFEKFTYVLNTTKKEDSILYHDVKQYNIEYQLALHELNYWLNKNGLRHALFDLLYTGFNEKTVISEVLTNAMLVETIYLAAKYADSNKMIKKAEIYRRSLQYVNRVFYLIEKGKELFDEKLFKELEKACAFKVHIVDHNENNEKISEEVRIEMLDWCEKNLDSSYTIGAYKAAFRDESHSMAFKLRWVE